MSSPTASRSTSTRRRRRPVSPGRRRSLNCRPPRQLHARDRGRGRRQRATAGSQRRGLNIATNPGTTAEDSSQSLNPSVNGRADNNGLRVTASMRRTLLNANGGLGNSIIFRSMRRRGRGETSLPSAVARPEMAAGSVELITRPDRTRFSGFGRLLLQHEKLNSNEFFLNRAGVAKPNCRRNDTPIFTLAAAPALRGRTHFFGAAQSPGIPIRYASMRAATGLPTGSDRRSHARKRAPAVQHGWIRTGAQDDPRFAQTFMNARGRSGRAAGRLIAQFFPHPTRLVFRQRRLPTFIALTINILNQKRDGRLLIRRPWGQPLLVATARSGRRPQQQVMPPS